MELHQASGGDNARAKRRQLASYACAFLAVLALILQIFGLGAEGWTVRLLLLAGFFVAAALIVAWAQRKLTQAVLLISTSLLCVVVSEFALRHTIYRGTGLDDLFQFDAHLGWRFVPEESGLVTSDDYQQLVTVNQHGYRDFNHSDEATGESHGREKIVAVLGDSFTSNLGVDLEETFTTLLDNHLGPKYSIRNFGVNGYGQVQELLLLDEILENLRPDLVLLVIYTSNDLDDNIGRFDWIRGYKRPTAKLNDKGKIEITHGFGPPTRFNPSQTTLYHWIRTTALDRLVRTAIGLVDPGKVDPSWVSPIIRYARSPLASEERQAFDTIVALLSEFDRRTQAAGSKLGVVLAPAIYRIYEELWQDILNRFAASGDSHDVNQLHALLADDSDRNGRAHFDLVNALLAKSADGTELYYPNEAHWNRAGNAVVAEALAAWLRQSGLLNMNDTS